MTEEIDQTIQATEVSSPSKYAWIIVIVVLVFALFTTLLFWLFGSEWNVTANDTGVFGDSFGVLTSLFSGLAFAGMIITILLQMDVLKLQKNELKLQRTELKLTRNELKGQKEQQIAQNETLRKQNFENTFFELLKLFNDVTTSIDIEEGGQTFRGKDCFQKLNERFLRNYNNKINNHHEAPGLGMFESSYFDFHSANQSDVGHYFRSLYNLVKFVHENEIENKKFYTNLIRAQLSTFELVMLFYNCLSSFGSEKFKPLIEKYNFLQNICKNQIVNAEIFFPLYKKEAFE